MHKPSTYAHPASSLTASRRAVKLRMQGWDFTSPGWYFLTICTKNMRSEFGTVLNDKMVLNASGKIAARFWQEIETGKVTEVAVVRRILLQFTPERGCRCILFQYFLQFRSVAAWPLRARAAPSPLVAAV